jgi:hypothetical protein
MYRMALTVAFALAAATPSHAQADPCAGPTTCVECVAQDGCVFTNSEADFRCASACEDSPCFATCAGEGEGEGEGTVAGTPSPLWLAPMLLLAKQSLSFVHIRISIK